MLLFYVAGGKYPRVQTLRSGWNFSKDDPWLECRITTPVFALFPELGNEINCRSDNINLS